MYQWKPSDFERDIHGGGRQPDTNRIDSRRHQHLRFDLPYIYRDRYQRWKPSKLPLVCERFGTDGGRHGIRLHGKHRQHGTG